MTDDISGRALESEHMAIRIGTAPVSWGIMEVETSWDRRQTYQSVLDEMVSAGYEGTELGPWEFLPTDPKQLTAELARRNLRLISAFVPIPLAQPERHQAGIESALATARLLAACGAPVVVLADEMDERRMAVAGVVDEQRDGLSDRQWDAAAKLLDEVAREVTALGVRAAFHHHAGTYVETPREVERLLASTDPSLLGLCLDTGHYLYGGGDPVDVARRYATRIWHIHLKDVRRNVLDRVRREHIGFLDAVSQGVFSELGAGTVDLLGVIRGLQASGFDGWAVFEQDVDPSQPGVEPLKSAARSRQYLRDAAGL
jgi:inosose dehydratase